VNLNTGAPPSILELPFDEARAVASLVFNGVVTRYPDIKFMISHAGGPIPVLATRMDQLMRNPRIAERLPEGVPAALKKLYFEVANSTVNPSAMAALNALVPPSQILFGSDYPYVRIEKTVSGLDRLDYGPDMLAAINHTTALKLFPRFA
jgi:predicted TIM-barrel fold metal-dependent hydrolase